MLRFCYSKSCKKSLSALISKISHPVAPASASTPQIAHADLLNIIQENVQDLIALINVKRERIWFNDAYCNTLGYARAELESGDSTAKLHPDDIQSIRKSFDEVMASGRGRALEYRMQHKLGHWIWLESRSRVIENVPEIGKCVILVARNITRRKEQELQRIASEQRLQLQKQELMELTHSPELHGDDRNLIAWKVASAARKALSLREVSIWWLKEDVLECQGSTRGGRGWECLPRCLKLESEYRNRLETASSLALNEGMEDRLATCWRTSGTVSANLQVPLQKGGSVVGLMVCSEEAPHRKWHADEQSYAETLGSILMQSLEAQERRAAFTALEISQAKLSAELAEAASYVQALLPAPFTGTPSTEWIFVPSEELGGDAVGYHWIDEEHLALYLLDVCGHGVGAALLSISALNVLRNSAMPGIDCRSPARVMRGMNHAFEMEKHNNMYFTLWYGVWNRKSRELTCCSGGHPRALLLSSEKSGETRFLGKPGLVIGAMPDIIYEEQRCVIPEGASLLLFSDGAYEITRTDGSIWTYEEFTQMSEKHFQQSNGTLLQLVEKLLAVRAGKTLEDDCTVLLARF